MNVSLENAASSLTEREKIALIALETISHGRQAFLNVIDADVLVSKGLADQFGSQYILTDDGWSLLKTLKSLEKT